MGEREKNEGICFTSHLVTGYKGKGGGQNDVRTFTLNRTKEQSRNMKLSQKY